MLKIETRMINNRMFGKITEYYLYDGEKFLCDARSLESLSIRAEEHGVAIKTWFEKIEGVWSFAIDIDKYFKAIGLNVKKRNTGVIVQYINDVMVFMSRGSISMYDVIPEKKEFVKLSLYDYIMNYEFEGHPALKFKLVDDGFGYHTFGNVVDYYIFRVTDNHTIEDEKRDMILFVCGKYPHIFKENNEN